MFRSVRFLIHFEQNSLQLKFIIIRHMRNISSHISLNEADGGAGEALARRQRITRVGAEGNRNSVRTYECSDTGLCN